jgi:hypothetical protein
MLAGEAVVAIWNGIATEARADFYDWHDNEHMPERVGIPGFRRGRRLAALDPATAPEFFTLYEAETMPVLTGADYARRLNAPTPATRAIMPQFRGTVRALATVEESRGPGTGGVLGTLRFDAETWLMPELRVVVRSAATLPRVVGAHLCRTDMAASGAPTVEARSRTDADAPPAWFVLVEATDADALGLAELQTMLMRVGAREPMIAGRYRLEYLRSKTGFAS